MKPPALPSAGAATSGGVAKMEPAVSPAASVPTAKLEMNAWTAQEERILASQRYLQLREHGNDEGFEPGCVERAIVAAVAPDSSLVRVVARIAEIYAEIKTHTRDVIEGVPALRVVKQKCTNANCDNDNPNEFIPSRGGAVACMRCGDCQSDYVIHEGEMYRNFTGEEDRSHHGPRLNPLYSASYNLGTQFTGLRGQKRTTGRETDFSVSNIGRDPNAAGGAVATRVEYKDDQKSKAFRIMREQGANLELHGLVRKKAEELFAAYRDARDRLFDFEAVVAACLITAHLEVLVEEGSDGSHGHHLFVCPSCGLGGFTAKRDADKHCTVLGPGGGSSKGLSGNGSGGQDHPASSVRKTSAEMKPVPEVHKMNLREVKALLMHESGEAPFRDAAVAGICAGLLKELKSLAGKGSDDEDEGGGGGGAVAAEEGEYKAGQLLVMASLKVLTGWCHNDVEAGKLYFDYLHDIKKKKSERDVLLEEEEQDRKRRRQQEEKPIFAELVVPPKGGDPFKQETT